MQVSLSNPPVTSSATWSMLIYLSLPEFPPSKMQKIIILPASCFAKMTHVNDRKAFRKVPRATFVLCVDYYYLNHQRKL